MSKNYFDSLTIDEYFLDLREKGMIGPLPEPRQMPPDYQAFLDERGKEDIKELDKAMGSDSPPF